MSEINLLNRARNYLDLNGFPMVDMDMYCPKENDWDYGAITLRSHEHNGLEIYVFNPLCSVNSSEIK